MFPIPLLLMLIEGISPCFGSASKSYVATVTWTPRNGYQLLENKLHHSPDTVAWGNYTNEVNSTGWSYLEVHTSDQFPDKVQVFFPTRQRSAKNPTENY